MRTWTAVAVTTIPAMAEAVESFLLDHGAPGLQSEDRDGRVRTTAHFAVDPPLAELDALLAALGEQYPEAPRAEVAVGTVTDTGWADNWKAHFPPLTIGRRLFVHPPWIAEVPADRLAILLDPGMAFGTGQHASTRGCLVLLEAALAERSGARVLDLGTGSGILAIAAAKLGAAEVVAVDIDPDACAAARDNARVNEVAGLIRFGDTLDAVDGAFDVVVANLLATTLIELADRLAARLAPGGILIGAGVLADEAAAVRAAWRAAGLRATDEDVDEGWVALAARRAV